MGKTPVHVRVWLLVFVTMTVTSFEVLSVDTRQISRSDWAVALALLVLIVIVERSDISIPLSSGTLLVSVGAPIALASTMHLGVGLGSLVVLTGHLLDSALARRDPIKSITNICTFVSAASSAGLLYASIADTELSPLGSVTNLVATLTASGVFVLVSTLTMAIVVGPIIGLSVWEMWQSTVRLSAIEAVALPTIGGLVGVVATANAAAVLLMAFPLIGPQLAYRAMLNAQRSVKDALETLNDVVEQRDVYTSNHSVRVQSHVAAILDELRDIPHELVETILAAARVHDVGKVGTRDLTLFKPGPLTPAERLEVQRHAEIGGEIVSRISEYRLTASIIRHHHEFWNGTGYPDRLVGQEIPLGSRVIAVADAYDAMTSDRPYRSGMSGSAALADIRRHSGTQFDPRVVVAFERVLEQEWSARNVPGLKHASVMTTAT